MWRPPERIKHNAGGGTWPTAAEAAAVATVFSRRGWALTLTQRTWVPAMSRGARVRTGLSLRKCLNGTSGFARGQPGPLLLRLRGSETCQAVPCSALDTIGFCPACATSFAWCAKRAADKHVCSFN